MKRISMGIVGIAMLAIALLPAADKTQDAERQLKAAMNTELVDGNLKAALEQYKKLAQSSDRATAAKAVLRMGECYEKLGSSEARKQYDLVIRKFPEQRNAVEEARARLGAPAVKSSEMAERRVWDNADVSGDSSVSPNGRYICFYDWDKNGLAVRDLNTNTSRVVVPSPNPGDFAEGCSFSPGSDQIAYSFYVKKDEDYVLRIADLTQNAAPRSLFKNDHRPWYGIPAWSPDGKQIAVEIATGPKSPDEILLITVKDGTLRSLPKGYDGHAFFSPDGKYLAYDRKDHLHGPSDVYVYSLAAGREEDVVDYPSDDVIMGWTSDNHILFASDRTGPMSLWSVAGGKAAGQPQPIRHDVGVGDSLGLTASGALYYRIENGGRSGYLEVGPFDMAAGRFTSAPTIIGAVDRSSQGSWWSPDGKFLAYIKPGARTGGGVLAMLSSNGQTTDLRSDRIAWPMAIAWAPDGHTLAGRGLTRGISQSDAQAGAAAITMIDEEASGGAGGPFWSPDQKKLYVRKLLNPSPSDPYDAIMERDMASGTERELFRHAANSMGNWWLSPDGRWLGIVINDAPAKTVSFQLVPVSGGQPRELLRGPALGAIAFSPDSRFIATSEGGKSIVLIPVAGGEVKRLIEAEPPMEVRLDAWSPDSQSILIKRRNATTSEQTEIWRLPVDGSKPLKLDVNANMDHMIGSLSFSPDGKQAAFIRGDRLPATTSVVALENFMPAPVRK